MSARTQLSEAVRLGWQALGLLAGALLAAAGLALGWGYGQARVHGFRVRVRVRRALARYFKKRKVARVRRCVLVLSFGALIAVIAAQPGAQEMVTAAVGLAGIAAARLAPGKLTVQKRTGKKI